jgi:hypothetical protein
MKTGICICFLMFCILNISLHAQVTVTKKSMLPASQAITSSKDIFLSTIDPAVTKIVFATIKQSSGDKMHITGFVKNIGGKDFKSNANQQIIQLWEIRTPSDKQMLKQLPFTNLNVGQEIKIEYDLPALKPADEFPPDYQVVIVYDPDILIDANKNNDDANNKNNSLLKNPRN